MCYRKQNHYWQRLPFARQYKIQKTWTLVKCIADNILSVFKIRQKK